MSSQLSIEDAAVLAVRRAVEAGATEAEAYVVQVKGHQAYANNNLIVGTRAISEAGVGVRVAVGKRIGFSYASSLELREITEAARRAVKAAKSAPEDPEWKGLPEPSSYYPTPEAVYDVSIARMRPERAVEALSEMIEEATSVKGVTVNRAMVTVRVTRRAIASTNGMLLVDIGTHVDMWILVAAERDGITTPLVFHNVHSRVSIPSPRHVARTAVEKATRSFRIAKLDSPKRMDVVFEPLAFAELLEYTLLPAVSGDRVVRGTSPFADKLGEQVFDEKLTLIDDGTLRQGYNTWRFDGEGIAMQKTVVIEKGVFRMPLFDHYWAARAGLESTGNATRNEYLSPPRVGTTNVVIERGDASIDELLEGEVLLVQGLQGAHSSNPVTGEYSVLAAPGWIVKDGEYYLAPGVMLAGNIFAQLAKNLVAIGSWHEDLPGFRSPWVRVSNVVVTPRV